jgi:pyruvate dehydrogenase E1 component alpha subunit
LPVVFVCENNRWAESTPQSQHQPIDDLLQRPLAYGMQSARVDGQDVEAVYIAAARAIAHARAGEGPVFLLCETERLTGHYIGDPQVYRDKGRLEELRETRDPIENLRRRLELSEAEWTDLDTRAQEIVDDAIAFALAGTDPEPEDALKFVYAPPSAPLAPTGAGR